MLPGEEGFWLVIIFVGLIFMAVIFLIFALGVLSCLLGVRYRRKSKESNDMRLIKKYNFWSYFWFSVLGLDLLVVLGYICREIVLNALNII